MLRRMNLMGLCVALMFLTVGPVRNLASESLEDLRVQAFVKASANTGAIATSALIEYVRTRPITFVNGKPVITVSGPGGTTKTVSLDTDDNWSLDHGASLSAAEVEAVLTGYDSPAAGKGVGEASVKFSQTYDIDNGYWLAMFIHESTAGTADGWAGNKGGGHYTANTGNIIGSYNGKQFGRFRDYEDDWVKGTEQHFQLLACYQSGGGEEWCDGLYSGKKHETIVDAIATWAPAEDNNNPESYANAVKKDVSNWRSVHTTVATSDGNDLRAKVIEKALSLKGTSYSQVYNGALGFRPDCSGTVSFIYKDVTGINIGSTTYDIFPNLKPVEEKDLQPGDIWFGVWDGSPPNNEHMGIVADVNGDGKWDLLHNGADLSEQHVTESFLETYLGEHTKGFRTVLGK